MTNLNILLAFIYTLLIILELLIVKQILNTKLRAIQQKGLQLKTQIRSRNTTHNNKPSEIDIAKYSNLTIKQFLQFALNHHFFFKFWNEDFCKRIYQMFIIGIIINNYMCQGNLQYESYSLISTTVIEIAVLVFLDYIRANNQISIKNIFEQEVQILKNEINPETGDLQLDVDEYILQKYSFRFFISELIYFCISILALLLVSKKFYETENMILVPIEEIKIMGLFVGFDLFILRPFALLTYGFICYTRYSNNREQFIQNNSEMMKIIMKQDIQEPVFRGLTKKSPQKERRLKQGVPITLEDNTEQVLHTIQNAPIELQNHYPNASSIQETYQNHSKQQQESLQPHQIIVFQTLKPTEESHSSPIPKNITSTPSVDSQTIKKQQNPLHCVQISRNDIRQIEEFQITQFAPNQTRKYPSNNNVTNKIHNLDQEKDDHFKQQEMLAPLPPPILLLETLTNQQQLLNHNPSRQTIQHIDTNQNIEQQNTSQQLNQNIQPNDLSENKSKIIIKQNQISTNNFKKDPNGYSDQSFHKVKYNNASIIGKIIDENHHMRDPFSLKIENSDSNFYPAYNNSSFIHFSPINENPAKEVKKRQNARNRRIHLVYTNQQTQKQSTKRSVSQNTQKQLQAQKENIKSSTNVNEFVNKKFVYNSMLLPNVKPMEIVMRKQNKKKNSSDMIQFAQEVAEKKKKRKRSTTRRAREQEFMKQKSPYLEFLPKMLKKQEKKEEQVNHNNQHQTMTRKEESQRNPSKQKSKSQETKKVLKKYNQELIVIKRTLPAELETVYT